MNTHDSVKVWFSPLLINNLPPPGVRFHRSAVQSRDWAAKISRANKAKPSSEPLLVILAEERRGQLALLFPSSVDKPAFTSAIILLGDLTPPR